MTILIDTDDRDVPKLRVYEGFYPFMSYNLMFFLIADLVFHRSNCAAREATRRSPILTVRRTVLLSTRGTTVIVDINCKLKDIFRKNN